MAYATSTTKTSRLRPPRDSTLLSHSGLDDTLHSTQSLSGRTSIMTYNNRQYPSASAALAAYISDFEGARPLGKMYHRTVEDLLTPRSVLLRTVDRSLDTGVRDTKAEWRRYVTKKLLDESYDEMVQADLEREKAQSLIESTRHLTSDLSPLPGSSLLTEAESEVSVATDALLLAPPYLPVGRPPPLQPQGFIPRGSQGLRTEAGRRIDKRRLEERKMQGSRRHGLGVRRSQTEANPSLKLAKIPQFPSDISPVKKPVRGSEFANLKEAQTRRGLVKSGSRVAGSPALPGGSPRGMSDPRRDPQVGGQRAAPSWIQDLEGSGISDLVSGTHPGGRAPPSWIQDLEASGISSHVKSELLERRDGGRPPPSWIQDLNSTFTSGIRDSSTLARHPGYLATRSRGQGRRSTQTRNPHRRSNSASDLITSDVFHDVTETSQPPGLTATDLDYSEHISKSLDRERLPEDSGRRLTSIPAVNFSENAKPTKTYSYTTDDLILASPTGKGFHLPPHSSRGQYSPNAFSNKYSHSNSSRRTGYSDHLAAKHSFGAAELFQHKTTSPRGDATDLLSSTPKHSVHFVPNFSSRSVNRYTNEGLTTQTGGGFSMHTFTGKAERTSDEVDREREDALLKRAEKVLHAARASGIKPNRPSTRHQFEESDRQEDSDRHDNSLLTEEVLDGDRPWERNLPAYKPMNPTPDASQAKPREQSGIVAQVLEDCLQSTSENQKLTGGCQPGPVEALKNMLFTLQGMDANTQGIVLASENAGRQISSSETSMPSFSRSKVMDSDTTASSGSGTNFDEAPGGKSLQRAMEHLSRLKVLVNGGSDNSHPSSTNAQVISN